MPSLFEIVAELDRAGQRAALATIVAADGSTPRKVGTKMAVLPTGEIHGTIGGGALEAKVIEDARRAIAANTSGKFLYALDAATGQCCGGKVEVFIDVIGSSNPLYIFGAGHVGLALAQILDGTPFTPHLIDDRADWIRSQRIPENAVLHLSTWKPFAEEHALVGTYAVVMTHSHTVDFEIISHLCRKKWKYLGLIGSATKWGLFKKGLQELGRTEKEISAIKCPMGNKKLGHAPQEIAISISSELLEIHYAL